MAKKRSEYQVSALLAKLQQKISFVAGSHGKIERDTQVRITLQALEAGESLVVVKRMKFGGKVYAIGDKFEFDERLASQAERAIRQRFVVSESLFDAGKKYASLTKFSEQEVDPRAQEWRELNTRRGELAKKRSTLMAELESLDRDMNERDASIKQAERDLRDLLLPEVQEMFDD